MPASDGRSRHHLIAKKNSFLGDILALKVISMREGYFSPNYSNHAPNAPRFIKLHWHYLYS